MTAAAPTHPPLHHLHHHHHLHHLHRSRLSALRMTRRAVTLFLMPRIRVRNKPASESAVRTGCRATAILLAAVVEGSQSQSQSQSLSQSLSLSLRARCQMAGLALPRFTETKSATAIAVWWTLIA